ncbi:MAG: Holliday junction branch migration protein RuvA [Ruminococcus sp.]|nr:Holliday junction branch migration protein RuvA [Candidatus Copronaster equi]
MFYSLSGKVVLIDKNGFAIQCNGIAFYCFSTLNTMKKIKKDDTFTVYTYLNVREDAMELYGFADTNELEAFKQLITVSGVGPKAGLAILSVLAPDKLALSIASGDVKSITAAQGVGTKIAQRVILELKNKFTADLTQEQTEIVSAAQVSNSAENCNEAIEGLIQLGYSRSEAAVAVGKLDSTLPVEELIRLALKSLI